MMTSHLTPRFLSLPARFGRFGWPPAILCVGLLTFGCGDDADPVTPTAPVTPPTAPPPDPEPGLDLPTDPDALFLVLWEGPSFTPIEYALGQPPLYALSGAGNLWSEGPVIAIYPGPLLPSIQLAEIHGDDFDAVLELIQEIGLHELDEERIEQPSDRPVLADAPALDVVFTDRSGTHVLTIDAYHSEFHRDPRVTLIRNLIDHLDGKGVAAGSVEWTGDRLQVYAGSGEIFDPSVLTERPWPLPDPPPATAGFECRIYEGAVAGNLLEVFAGANHGVRWEYEGSLYQLIARPLIPGEPGCER